MARTRDSQLFWILVFAAVFWVAIWQHDRVARYWHDLYKSVHAAWTQPRH